MKYHIFDSKATLYSSVASYYAEKINAHKNIVLGLATGTTPIPLYKNLINLYEHKKISFKGVKTFNLDEYIGLPSDHKETYFNFMRTHLFNHIDIDLDQTFIPSAVKGQEEASIKSYQTLLENNQIDLQLLGIGSNGHIGFNEPGTSFDSTTHIIKLAENTRKDNARLFSSIDEVPTHAITMGIKEIMNAKEIIVIATGKNKAEAVYQMILGKLDEQVPATILQKHPNVTVYLDVDAASKLK